MTTTLRWYQTTPARVYAIVTTILFFGGQGFVAMAAVMTPWPGDLPLLALGLFLILSDVLRRLHRLEARR